MTWKERQAAAYAAMKDIRNKMDKGEWNADLNLEFERLSKDLAAAEQAFCQNTTRQGRSPGCRG
jgi:hypothetical protein